MATESFLVTALPYSAAATEPFHVSFFVTHRLTPDGAEGKVGDFGHVRNWTGVLAGVPAANFKLRGATAGGAPIDIPVTPLLGGLEPDLWPRVFPPELAVRPWNVPNQTAVPWRTFPAHRMQQHALLAHWGALASSPVTPPTVKGNAFAVLVLN